MMRFDASGACSTFCASSSELAWQTYLVLGRRLPSTILLYMICFPECLKPKLHFFHHMPDLWEFWKALLSCYGAEADHREACRTFRFAISDPSRTSLAYAINALLETVETDSTYEEVFLFPPVHRCREEFVLDGSRCIATGSSSRVQATIGIFKKDDCLTWKHGGTVHCGKALFFADITHVHSRRVDVVCVVRGFTRVADGWWQDSMINHIVGAGAVEHKVPYLQLGLRIMPIIPDL